MASDGLQPCIHNQLDAQQLDTDIMRVLGAQWNRIFATCGVRARAHTAARPSLDYR